MCLSCVLNFPQTQTECAEPGLPSGACHAASTPTAGSLEEEAACRQLKGRRRVASRIVPGLCGLTHLMASMTVGTATVGIASWLGTKCYRADV